MAAKIPVSADLRGHKFRCGIYLNRFISDLAGLNLDLDRIEMRSDTGLDARFIAFSVADTFALPDELPGGHAQELNGVICIRCSW
jgi:hypothetical protein